MSGSVLVGGKMGGACNAGDRIGHSSGRGSRGTLSPMDDTPTPGQRRHQPLALALACAALGVALATALLPRPPVAGAQPATTAQSGETGRYRVEVASRELNPVLVVVDTQTGHVWTANAAGGDWEDRGTPPVKK